MNDIECSAERVLASGYAIFRMPQVLASTFHHMLEAYDAVEEAERRGFSFLERDDGFLDFGTEYAEEESRPDLCRRFCYWMAHAALHERHTFSRSPLYQAAVAYEHSISALAHELLAAIGRHCGAAEAPATRRRSYMQLCDYAPALQDAGRRYMQDPHEDGHLLTFAKPTAAGLVFLVDGVQRPVELQADEMVVFAGSLLTQISDGRIAPVRHAVVTPQRPIARKALMYFVNPDADEGRSWAVARPLDFKALFVESMARFGNAAA